MWLTTVRDPGEPRRRRAVIRLDRPRANALSAQVLTSSRRGRVPGRQPAGSVVVTGGERIFAAGRYHRARLGRARTGLRQLPCGTSPAGRPAEVTIAAINGYALAGLELALACDLRICGESAKLGQPEVLLGVIPGAADPAPGAPHRSVAAKDLILTGRQVDADEALALGLVNRVVPDTRCCSRPSRSPPSSPGRTGGPVDGEDGDRRRLDVGVEEGLKIERRYFTAVLRTEDARRGSPPSSSTAGARQLRRSVTTSPPPQPRRRAAGPVVDMVPARLSTKC